MSDSAETEVHEASPEAELDPQTSAPEGETQTPGDEQHADSSTALPKERVKRLPRPDDAELKAQTGSLNDKIQQAKARVEEIKGAIAGKQGGRGSPEQAAVKARLSDLRNSFQQELVRPPVCVCVCVCVCVSQPGPCASLCCLCWSAPEPNLQDAAVFRLASEAGLPQCVPMAARQELLQLCCTSTACLCAAVTPQAARRRWQQRVTQPGAHLGCGLSRKRSSGYGKKRGRSPRGAQAAGKQTRDG